ncbi:MAG: complex I NDUFA9 subunit family protein [Nitrospinae bacterium]|nr:complex I NDUFA9 subunit family protein [Nitrospinota bacterium]
MNVFVTGATGFVGHHILHALRERGHGISALVRPGSEKKLPFTDGLRIVHGDVDGALAPRLEGMDAVIHLIGIIREFPARGITFEKLHYQATRRVVEAARRAGVKRFLHMSANGAAEQGVSAYQTTKWRAEREVMASGLDWTIFRPSVIFGGGGGAMEFTRTLAKVMARAPVMPVFGGGGFLLDPVSVEDVAPCFVRALAMPETHGRVFHLCAVHPLPYRDILKIIAAALGKPKQPMVNVPWSAIRPQARVFGRFGWFPVTVDQLDMLRCGNVCPDADWTRVFGVTPRTFTAENLSYLRRL